MAESRVDMPALFKSANDGSLRGQYWQVLLMRCNFILLVGAGLISSISWNPTLMPVAVPVISAIFVITIVLSSIIRIRQYEKVWFEARAAAESIKSIAWKYAMCAEPYNTTAGVDDLFLKDLTRILYDLTTSRGYLGDANGGSEITESMRLCRNSPLETRRTTYLKERVNDQRDWYNRKAIENARAETKLFGATLVVQVIAIAFAFVRTGQPDFPINLTAALATAASCLMAWTQLKQYEPLAQAYSVAVHDLSIVEDRGSTITNELDFIKFVSDAENAISREHTVWRARREVR